MAKQVHIHIHRNKTRDAGEGEGKGRWITLSPSGTHVKVDGKGEITAGPKGMAGKKPSELSKSKASSQSPNEARVSLSSMKHVAARPNQAVLVGSKPGSSFTFERNAQPSKRRQAGLGGFDLNSGKAGPAKLPTVNASSLKEGQALYDKSGQKVDEVESIQRRTLGKGLTINTRAGYQVHIDENGSNSQGWSNEKPGASGAAPTSQNQKIAAEMSKAPKPPSHPAAGGGALAADWSSSNGNWESAKKSGSSLVEKTLSAAKTQGDKTDAMLALKTRAAEEHKKGSYLGAVVVGLVNDYFDRLR